MSKSRTRSATATQAAADQTTPATPAAQATRAPAVGATPAGATPAGGATRVHIPAAAEPLRLRIAAISPIAAISRFLNRIVTKSRGTPAAWICTRVLVERPADEQSPTELLLEGKAVMAFHGIPLLDTAATVEQLRAEGWSEPVAAGSPD